MDTPPLDNPVAVLEHRYLPRLQRLADSLAAHHPAFLFLTHSTSLGSATSHQGHALFLEAVRRAETPDQPNCLSLEIAVRNLRAVPLLGALDVCWGADGRRPPTPGNLFLLDAAIPFDTHAIARIDAALPALKTHFAHAVTQWENAWPRVPTERPDAP
jgi:hypothetical protein